MNPLLQAAVTTRAAVLAPVRHRQMRLHCQSGTAPMNVLFYHRVADVHPNDWTISRADFTCHVDYCCENFELIGLDEIQRRVDAGFNNQPSVTFTFDDGYAENCDFALPLLIQRGVPTVYFVATGHVRHGRPFGHDVRSGTELAVNTPGQIRELAKSGIEIGLHTRNHVDFATIRDPRIIDHEIIHAKQELEDMIGRQVRYFAVPFGLPAQLTPAVIDATRRAGLLGFCSAFGAYNLVGRDSFHIRRFHGDPSFARLKNWLSFDPRKVAGEPVLNNRTDGK